ncbi:TPA: hypothetical protein MDR45_000029 [Klebsiella variicola]|nr:hypothetical protein [Klebsiella variicola]
MKKLIITLALLTPVAVQTDTWTITCGGVKLIRTNNKELNTVDKGVHTYAITGSINSGDGGNYSVFNQYIPNVSKNNNVIPVDANKSILLIQIGSDNSAEFRMLDERGNHKCSVQSFNAGE